MLLGPLCIVDVHVGACEPLQAGAEGISASCHGSRGGGVTDGVRMLLRSASGDHGEFVVVNTAGDAVLV